MSKRKTHGRLAPLTPQQRAAKAAREARRKANGGSTRAVRLWAKKHVVGHL